MARMPFGHTLQPTALVHEAWMKLSGGKAPAWQNRAHFLAAAAEAMRHILIDRARKRRTERHGGNQKRIPIEDVEIPLNTEDEDLLLAVSAAIDKLTLENAEVAALVKLRCFAGLETSEAARVLGLPRATAYRRWAFARAWLYKELSG